MICLYLELIITTDSSVKKQDNFGATLYTKKWMKKRQWYPLVWWKIHEAAFPYLSALSKTVLSIPSSSGANNLSRMQILQRINGGFWKNIRWSKKYKFRNWSMNTLFDFRFIWPQITPTTCGHIPFNISKNCKGFFSLSREIKIQRNY